MNSVGRRQCSLGCWRGPSQGSRLRPWKLFELPRTLLGPSVFIGKMVPEVPRGCGATWWKGPAQLSLCTKDSHLQNPSCPPAQHVHRQTYLLTPRPAPSLTSSLLSTKSSFSCHPSLRSGGRASAVQNADPLYRRKMKGGSERLSPSLRSQLMQRRGRDSTKCRTPCSRSSCLCSQAPLCPGSA